MSITTHVNEYYDVEEFLGNVAVYNGTDNDEVRRFLASIYPGEDFPEDDQSFDMDKGADDPGFKIKVIDNSNEEYYEENFLYVSLPSRDKADELADLLDGKVIKCMGKVDYKSINQAQLEAEITELLDDNFKGAVSDEYRPRIIKSILPDVVTDVVECSDFQNGNWNTDDIRFAVGRVLCDKLGI